MGRGELAVLKSKTLFKPLREVFDSGSGDEFHASLAALCVLYEDMRLELHGIGEDEIEPIDGKTLGDKYRRFYFVRRAAATQLEFSGSLKRLSASPMLKAARKRSESLHGGDWKTWDDAVRFFQSSQHHDVLKKLRNDVGGHLHFAGASWAVENLSPKAVGRLEMGVRGDKLGYRLQFAGEIAGTAAMRHLKGGDTEAKTRQLIVDIILEGSKHATAAMRVLIENYLLDRFGFWSSRSRRRREPD
jgi:hypothetical protein